MCVIISNFYLPYLWPKEVLGRFCFAFHRKYHRFLAKNDQPEDTFNEIDFPVFFFFLNVRENDNNGFILARGGLEEGKFKLFLKCHYKKKKKNSTNACTKLMQSVNLAALFKKGSIKQYARTEKDIFIFFT